MRRRTMSSGYDDVCPNSPAVAPKHILCSGDGSSPPVVSVNITRINDESWDSLQAEQDRAHSLDIFNFFAISAANFANSQVRCLQSDFCKELGYRELMNCLNYTPRFSLLRCGLVNIHLV